MLSTNGARKSSQVSRTSASFAVTSSAAFVSMPPDRAKAACAIGVFASAKAGNSSDSISFCSQRATGGLSDQIFTSPPVSVLFRNSAWPAPAGHHSTRQWLARSVCVLPPSAL